MKSYKRRNYYKNNSYYQKNYSKTGNSKGVIQVFLFIFILPFKILYWIIKGICKAFKKTNTNQQIFVTDKNPKNPYIEEPKDIYKKKKLLTNSEISYARAIYKVLPKEYRLYPQICLASVIHKTIENTFANELFRIADFGIFDQDYNVVALIEINDSSHKEWQRRARDSKVKIICESADIPLITFWTEYGIDEHYIQKRINEHLKLENYA